MNAKVLVSRVAVRVHPARSELNVKRLEAGNSIHATDRDQQPYGEVLDFMKRKVPGKEEVPAVPKKKRA